MMSLLSHADDGVAKMMLDAVWCHRRDMLAMVLLSHASDGTVEATWLKHDVDAKSCLATVLPKQLGYDMM
jgi:hypothetical protein